MADTCSSKTCHVSAETVQCTTREVQNMVHGSYDITT